MLGQDHSCCTVPHVMMAHTVAKLSQALEHIPPLPYSAMRITFALPLLYAGARIKVTHVTTLHP